MNRSPDPATRSRTVLDTRTSPGAAPADTRAPLCTAIPPIFAPILDRIWPAPATKGEPKPVIKLVVDAQDLEA